MTPRTTVALLLCTAPLLAGDEAPATEDSKPGKQTLITVSEETTHLVEPLDDAGFVDYLAAVDRTMAKGVTPENNFEVVIRRVMGPDEVSESIRDEYYRRIGIGLGTGPFHRDFLAFHGDLKGDDRESLFEEYDVLVEEPWRAADHPRAVAWLRAAKDHLDAIVEGSKRSRFYTPYVDSGGFDEIDGPGPRLIAVLLPSVQSLRELTRSLRIRAHMHMGEGDLEAAWEDVLAMFRTSRLAGRGFTIIEALVGYAIDSMAFETTRELLNLPQLSDDLARRILADLKALPPVPGMAEKIDRGERLMGLDCIQALARAGRENVFRTLKLLNDLSAIDQPARNLAVVPAHATTFVALDDETDDAKEPANDPSERPAELTINWDVTARIMNGWYDRLVEAAGTEDFDDREELFAKLEKDLKSLSAKARDMNRLLLELFSGKPRDQVGKLFGEILVALLLPAVERASVAEYEAIARFEVLRLAAAAEVYRRENDGKAAEKLSDLAPKYVASVPVDPLSGKPLNYVKGDGFVLYSVGRNGTDDDGRDHNEAEEARGTGSEVDWDDVVVRVGGGE